MAVLRSVMLRIALKRFLIFVVRKPSLVSSNSCCYCLHGEEVQDMVSTHTYESLHVYQQHMKIRMQPKVALQILLLLSGDIERCPGPEENEVRLDFDRILRCKGLKLFHLNIRGLWTNLSNISQIFSDNKNIDILSLGETHIADEPGEMYTIDGYTFVNRPRKNGKGGGVACYVAT